MSRLRLWNTAVQSPVIFVNTLRPRQHGRHFADDTFKRIFLNENVIISIKISLKFVPDGPINNIPALVQIMAWRRLGDKPLSEPMMVLLLTHICVTRPQWVQLSRQVQHHDMIFTSFGFWVDELIAKWVLRSSFRPCNSFEYNMYWHWC